MNTNITIQQLQKPTKLQSIKVNYLVTFEKYQSLKIHLKYLK